MSPSGGYHSYIGGVQYIERTSRFMWGNVGDTMSTLEDVRSIGGYHEYIGGYHDS